MLSPLRRGRRLALLPLLAMGASAMAASSGDGPYRGRDPLEHVGDWVARISEDDEQPPGDDPVADGSETAAPAAPPTEPQEPQVTVRPLSNGEVRTILADDAAALGAVISGVIERLWMPWDTGEIPVVIAPGIVPEVRFEYVALSSGGGRLALAVSLGAMAFTENVDELAFLIAREMARRAPGRLSSKRSQELLDTLLGEGERSTLPDTRNGELAADVLAMDRMIKGGYNPLAAHNHLARTARWWRSMGRSDFAAAMSRSEQRPAMEQRLQLVKLYFMRKIEEQDLAEQTSRKEALPERLAQLRQRTRQGLFKVQSPFARMLGIERRFSEAELEKFYCFITGSRTRAEEKARAKESRRLEKERKRAQKAQEAAEAKADRQKVKERRAAEAQERRRQRAAEKAAAPPRPPFSFTAALKTAAQGIAALGIGAVMLPVAATKFIYDGLAETVVPGAWDFLVAGGGFVVRHGSGWSLFNVIFPQSQRQLLTGSLSGAQGVWAGYSRDVVADLQAGRPLTAAQALQAAESLIYELKALDEPFHGSRIHRNLRTFNGHMTMWENRIYLLGEALQQAQPLVTQNMEALRRAQDKAIPAARQRLENLINEAEEAYQADLRGKTKDAILQETRRINARYSYSAEDRRLMGATEKASIRSQRLVALDELRINNQLLMESIASDPERMEAIHRRHEDRHRRIHSELWAYLDEVSGSRRKGPIYRFNLERESNGGIRIDHRPRATINAREALHLIADTWQERYAGRITRLLELTPRAVYLDPRLHEDWLALLQEMPGPLKAGVSILFSSRESNNAEDLQRIVEASSALADPGTAPEDAVTRFIMHGSWSPLNLHHYHNWKDRLAAHSLSPESTPAYRSAYLDLLRRMKSTSPAPIDSIKVPGSDAAYPSWRLLSQYWSSALSGEAATMAQVALNDDYGQNWLFGLAMRGEHAMLRQNLRARIESVGQLTAYADINWAEKGVHLQSFARDFAEVILEKPHWIGTPRDVDALLDSAYLWPRLGSLRQSKFEQRVLGSASRLFGERSHWQYDPQVSGRMHALLLKRMEEEVLLPSDGPARLELWRRMTERGVTWVTDSFLEGILKDADDELRAQAYALAIGEQRIWDPTLKSTLLWDKITRQEPFKDLVASRTTELTEAHQEERLGKLAALLEENFTRQSTAEELALLETLSRAIATSWKESLHIASFLRSRFGTAETDQRGVIFENLTDLALEWPAADQENLVYFLRGDEEPSARLRSTFSYLGPERIRRMYANLPLAIRVSFIDKFLDSDRGLLHREGLFSADYTARFLKRLTHTENREAQEIAHEILSAFFEALDGREFSLLKSYIISYLLAVDPSTLRSPAHVLKQACIAIGTTGIKLGQQIAASRILDGADGNTDATDIMAELQENARDPLRHSKYVDILDQLRRKEMPFRLLDNLGSASMKSADRALDYQTGNTLVLKIMHEEAVNRTRLEFSFLDAMSAILKRKNARRYYMAGSVVRAAKESVQRELSMADEVKKSRLAQRLYAPFADFQVPNEALIADRLSAAQFAPGVGIRKLTPPQQAHTAKRVLETGVILLFGGLEDDDDGSFNFDPDRHPGNFRHEVRGSEEARTAGGGVIHHAIDWGQLIAMTKGQRRQVIRLFAIAAVLARAGVEEVLLDEITQTLGVTVDEAQRQALAAVLRPLFPIGGKKDITNYYTLLAALEEWGQPQPIVFFDFVRAIMQYDFYERFLSAEDRASLPTPSKVMEAQVRAEAARIEPRLTGARVRAARWFNFFRTKPPAAAAPCPDQLQGDDQK